MTVIKQPSHPLCFSLYGELPGNGKQTKKTSEEKHTCWGKISPQTRSSLEHAHWTNTKAVYSQTFFVQSRTHLLMETNQIGRASCRERV